MNIEKLTIAHISDLHRSQESPISNAALLDSLLLDRDNYVKKFSVRSPDILIVSGDIIYGSNDPNNFDEIIKKQYDEAFEFLDEIAKEFFAGERSRIAIIPGNHDVAWHYSKESMTKVQESEFSYDAGFLTL
ncbi:MAG: metallophosphoesterase [Verrucomicrobiales bacterium]|nr:metallophosphoesterase [Verrucomicrobiales bacterium]